MSYDRMALFNSISALIRKDLRMSLSQLSERLGISARTIETVVKSATGKTFRELHQEMVFSLAVSLFVSQPSLSIKELSFQVGYSSSRSFARRVKKMWGVTPRELRSAFVEGRQEVGHFPLLRIT